MDDGITVDKTGGVGWSSMGRHAQSVGPVQAVQAVMRGGVDPGGGAGRGAIETHRLPASGGARPHDAVDEEIGHMLPRLVICVLIE